MPHQAQGRETDKLVADKLVADKLVADKLVADKLVADKLGAQPLDPCQSDILAHVHDAVISTDLSGIIGSWNRAAERIYGWTESEAIGRHVSLLYFDEDSAQVEAQVLAPLRAQGFLDLTLRKRHRTGRAIHVALRLSLMRDVAGQPIGMIGCSNDVTEQKAAEEATRVEREFADLLLQTAQFIVLILDPQGRIVRYNRFMEQLSGYRLEEVRGKDWFTTFLPPCDWDAIRGLFGRAIQRIETRGNINPILTKDGGQRLISWWDKTLVDAGGELSGLLCVGHDITDLIAAQERAVEAERLAAIGKTIAVISHEACGELFAMRTALELLPQLLTDRDKALRFIGQLSDCHDRLHRLFDDLRSFASPLQLELAPCDLSEVWGQAWENLVSLHKDRDLALEVPVLDHPLMISADAFRLDQVFRNLFQNSLEACADPVRMRVAVAPVTTEAGSMIEIHVCDNGPGLSEEQGRQAFDAFYTSKSQGTGLGLSIVRRIVEAHGGSIRIGASAGSGAEFIVVLPSAAP